MYKVPYAFIQSRFPLTWSDVWFGLQHNYLELADVPAVALTSWRNGDIRQPVYRLAFPSGSPPERADIEALAQSEPEGIQSASKGRWLCLVLSWIYENRSLYRDPLEEVEIVYGDFDYPSAMARFVRWNPKDDREDLGGHEASIARLYDRWAAFNADCTRRHQCEPEYRDPASFTNDLPD